MSRGGRLFLGFLLIDALRSSLPSSFSRLKLNYFVPVSRYLIMHRSPPLSIRVRSLLTPRFLLSTRLRLSRTVLFAPSPTAGPVRNGNKRHLMIVVLFLRFVPFREQSVLPRRDGIRRNETGRRAIGREREDP